MEIERETREIDQIELFPNILDFPWENSQFGKTRSFPERKIAVFRKENSQFPWKNSQFSGKKPRNFPRENL